MSNRILFIVPYFGRFHHYFQLWLQSCKYNATIDWLLLTDDETAYDYPVNVKVKYTTFKEVVMVYKPSISDATPTVVPLKMMFTKGNGSRVTASTIFPLTFVSCAKRNDALTKSKAIKEKIFKFRTRYSKKFDWSKYFFLKYFL